MFGETNDDNKKEKEGDRAEDVLRAYRRAVSFQCSPRDRATRFCRYSAGEFFPFFCRRLKPDTSFVRFP